MFERPSLKTFLIAAAACVLLAPSLLDAQGRNRATPPGRGGTPPGHGGTIPGEKTGKIEPVVAPEFDPRSAGAVVALLIGGSLVLMETRRRRKSER